MATQDPFDSALARPPISTAYSTSSQTELTEELLFSVDQPLQVQRCKQTGKDYLLCDYNRDGDSYQSPWSNEFDPPIQDGTLPSDKVRKLEMAANDAFDVYRDL
ncbi:F-actin-capping protein subunit beta [Tirmania nivea]|nr:F-actin-capping protein subunit beta [Tirmania nivea]